MIDAGFGAKGNPQFDPDGAVEDWVDFTAVGEFAASVGNHKVGTRAERLAHTTTPGAELRAYDGLMFDQLDGVDKGMWKYEGGWKPYKVPMAVRLDGTRPSTIAFPSSIPPNAEIAKRFGFHRFVTEVAFGNEYAPAVGMSPAFSGGLLHVSITPVATVDGLPGGQWVLDTLGTNQFRILYPGATTVRQRAYLWEATGYDLA